MNVIFEDKKLMMICILVVTGILIFGILIGILIGKISVKKLIKKERADAVKRSRAVLGGQFGEQLAPFLPNFPCNPGDVKFIGKPVDFIAFPGSAEGKRIEEVVFIEVKSGESTLSERERQIKEAVESKNVRYVEYKIN